MENENEIADNEVEFTDTRVNETVEVADPQTEEVESTSEVQTVDKTETQRVAQRIKEATEKAKQEALENHKGIKLIEKLAKQNNMTVEEYVSAVEEQEEKEKIKQLAEQKGIPEEFAKEFEQLKKKTEMLEITQKELENKKKEQKEFDDFYNFFKNDTGKVLTDISMIPEEVYKIKEKTNKSLTDSYITHKYNELKKAQDIIKANKENSETTTGSISSQADKAEEFISYAEFEKNKTNRSWVVKNLSKITKSKLKW